jgi:hypothetical protein
MASNHARPATVPTADRYAAQLDTIEREQRRQGEIIKEILRLLEQRGRGPRDAADAAVVPALARVFGSVSFTAKAALRRSQFDAVLRQVLEDAGVQSARELGWLLRELAGIDVEGFRVARVRASSAGHRWQVSVS